MFPALPIWPMLYCLLGNCYDPSHGWRREFGFVFVRPPLSQTGLGDQGFETSATRFLFWWLEFRRHRVPKSWSTFPHFRLPRNCSAQISTSTVFFVPSLPGSPCLELTRIAPPLHCSLPLSLFLPYVASSFPLLEKLVLRIKL